MKRSPRSRQPALGDSISRISVSISTVEKAALERIAEEKKVSLAWLIREAVSQFLKGETQGTKSSAKQKNRIK